MFQFQFCVQVLQAYAPDALSGLSRWLARACMQLAVRMNGEIVGMNSALKERLSGLGRCTKNLSLWSLMPADDLPYFFAGLIEISRGTSMVHWHPLKSAGARRCVDSALLVTLLYLCD